MATTMTCTLGDYISNRIDAGCILFWAGVGCPAGQHIALGIPGEVDGFEERNGLLDLEGTIDEDGTWQWSGEGDPTDDRANTIYRITCYTDVVRWNRMSEEVV